MASRTLVLATAALFLLVICSAVVAVPKDISQFHSCRDFAPWGIYERTIREEPPVPIGLCEASLTSVRFDGSDKRLSVEPTEWKQYRWQIIAVLTVILLQAALIFGLLLERRRRQLAELKARHHFMQLTHMGRTATANALSASIAHELNQPLGAILSNTQAAEVLLASRPDSDALKEILADIRRDDQRAADIVNRLRGLLKRNAEEAQAVDLADAIGTVVDILRSEATKNDVVMTVIRHKYPVSVRCDPIHLQQVVLNLAINAMEAMANCKPGHRLLTIHTSLIDDSKVEVSIADRGPGIPEKRLAGIFEPFVTTKPNGLGLGLSIVRTIIESHDGDIWAENRHSGGAIFRFTLSLA